MDKNGAVFTHISLPVFNFNTGALITVLPPLHHWLAKAGWIVITTAIARFLWKFAILYFIQYCHMLSLFQFLIFEALVSCFWASINQSGLATALQTVGCTAVLFLGVFHFAFSLLSGCTRFDNNLMFFVSNHFKYDYYSLSSHGHLTSLKSLH